jgi:hypothetical protein
MDLLQACLALLGTIAGIAAVFVNRRAANVEAIRANILQAEHELRAALRDKRIDDAAFWARRRKALGSWPYMLLCGLAACLLQSGCITRAKPSPMPLVIGQRVFAPAPGAMLTIPPLTPPAKQWYLVDDVGLLLWLEISVPSSVVPASVVPSSVVPSSVVP